MSEYHRLTLTVEHCSYNTFPPSGPESCIADVMFSKEPSFIDPGFCLLRGSRLPGTSEISLLSLPEVPVTRKLALVTSLLSPPLLRVTPREMISVSEGIPGQPPPGHEEAV